MARPSNKQFRTWATADIGKTDAIVVDADAEVCHDDTGAWVAAWIWVVTPEEKEER